MAYAGVWRRFAALWLDALIALPLYGLAYQLDGVSRAVRLYLLVPFGLFQLWYNIDLVRRYGGTPGMLLLKLRVAMVDGSSVTWKAAALRYVVRFALTFLSSALLAAGVLSMTDGTYFSLSFAERYRQLASMAERWRTPIDRLAQIWVFSEFVTMNFNERRRALQDFMGGTVVLQVGDRFSLPSLAVTPAEAGATAAERGRLLTVAALVFNAAPFLVMSLIPDVRWRDLWLPVASMVLVGAYLYLGLSWARWVVAVWSLLFGVGGLLQFTKGPGAVPSGRAVVSGVILLGCVWAGAVLVGSRSVTAFLCIQREARVPTAMRILGWCAVALAVGWAAWIAVDLAQVVSRTAPPVQSARPPS